MSERARDPLRVWLLSLATGGVYGVYWWLRAGEELREHLPSEAIDPVRDIVVGSLCLCYFFYLPLKYGAYIEEARGRLGLPVRAARPWAHALFTTLCLYGYATMQSDLNELWAEEARRRERDPAP